MTKPARPWDMLRSMSASKSSGGCEVVSVRYLKAAGDG